MFKLLILALLVLLSSGCTVVTVGAASAIGGTYYVSGEIKASYPVSISHLYKVTLYTFQTEDIKVVSVSNTKEDADIIGELSDGEKVSVHIYYNKEEQGTLGIRIGSIGDEKRSRELLKKMERYI
jgi:hypothetical protein